MDEDQKPCESEEKEQLREQKVALIIIKNRAAKSENKIRGDRKQVDLAVLKLISNHLMKTRLEMSFLPIPVHRALKILSSTCHAICTKEWNKVCFVLLYHKQVILQDICKITSLYDFT
jgi:hypothetical protein